MRYPLYPKSKQFLIALVSVVHFAVSLA
jgi:hypothetical protein